VLPEPGSNGTQALDHKEGEVRRKSVRITEIALCTWIACTAGHAKQPPANSEVTIRLRTAVVSNPGTVERAKQLARNMFASIGINLQWAHADAEPTTGISVDVELMGDDARDEESWPLAEAFPFAGMTGHITVRYDRVRSSSGGSKDLEPTLLGHVLVHEITHVLQCLDRHSEKGVMKAHWNTNDYCEMRWRPLTFTSQDIDLIRLGMQVLRERMDHRDGAAPAGHSTIAGQ